MTRTDIVVTDTLKGKVVLYCAPKDQQYILVRMTKTIEFHPLPGLRVPYTIDDAKHFVAAMQTAIKEAEGL